MGFTRSDANVTVHQSMPDYPSGEGYTTEQLKTAFDSSAAELKDDLNGLMTELEDSSSASKIGAAQLESEVGTSVQDKLEYLMSEIQGVALGDIPDGSITEAKLDTTYAGSLAKKDGTLQEGLSAEKLNGKTETQLMAAFLGTDDLTTISFAKGNTSGDQTETQTMTTHGGRFYLLLPSFQSIKVALYDAQTNKFLFATYLGSWGSTSSSVEDYAVTSFYAGTIRVHKTYNAEQINLSASYSDGTITFTASKHNTNSYKTPAGTIKVIELGGKVV